MKGLVLWFLSHWLLVAVVLSIFSGIRAALLFTPKEYAGIQKWFTRWYQLWLNLVCSFAGWTAIHIMYIRYDGKHTLMDVGFLTLFLIAILGITGHLAELIHGAARLLQSRLRPTGG